MVRIIFDTPVFLEARGGEVRSDRRKRAAEFMKKVREKKCKQNETDHSNKKIFKQSAVHYTTNIGNISNNFKHRQYFVYLFVYFCRSSDGTKRRIHKLINRIFSHFLMSIIKINSNSLNLEGKFII